MRVVLLVVLLARAALAQATDAPLAAVPIAAGAPAPGEGVWLSTEDAAHLAQECSAAQLENAELRKDIQSQAAPPPVGWVLVGGLALAAVGFVVGFVVHKQ